jgi:hypothetical protein
LLVATFFTLFFVPVMYSIMRKRQPQPEPNDDGTEASPQTHAPDGRQQPGEIV